MKIFRIKPIRLPIMRFTTNQTSSLTSRQSFILLNGIESCKKKRLRTFSCNFCIFFFCKNCLYFLEISMSRWYQTDVNYWNIMVVFLMLRERYSQLLQHFIPATFHASKVYLYFGFVLYILPVRFHIHLFLLWAVSLWERQKKKRKKKNCLFVRRISLTVSRNGQINCGFKEPLCAPYAFVLISIESKCYLTLIWQNSLSILIFFRQNSSRVSFIYERFRFYFDTLFYTFPFSWDFYNLQVDIASYIV